MDSLSTEVTLLTIGGEDRATCRSGDVQVARPGGGHAWHGPLSWLLAQALLNTPPASNWICILGEMERLTQAQGWTQPLLFCGQPTRSFGLRG